MNWISAIWTSAISLIFMVILAYVLLVIFLEVLIFLWRITPSVWGVFYEYFIDSKEWRRHVPPKTNHDHFEDR